ncbi:MAG TPA: carboxymuconolactone decarboxylase family protein [Mucilaginibacter sp.]|nr:carboxymuconolactone decarboxylase family protein [Mucilaginibacter sp.]
MEQRISFFNKGQNAMKVLFGFGSYLRRSDLDQQLLQLIEYRVSQINGCAYCLDMHSKDLRAGGETEQRIYMISVWRETSLYTPRERAALAWAEAVTKLTNGDVPDAVYEEALKQFSEQELVDLTFAVIAINSFNRINIPFRTPAGDYHPGQFATQTA